MIRSLTGWFKLCSAIVIATSLIGSTNGTVLFHNRAYHGSIIVGNYLYIDGGEITTWNGTGNGIQDGWGVQDGFSCYGADTCAGNITVLPDNNTYSIDLSSSWTNQTVELNTIQKTAPVLNQPALWLDVLNTTFYAYGGSTSWAQAAFDIPRPPANALWQFTPRGPGGSWSQAPLPSQSNFTSLSRCGNGATASGNGLGFALGGVETTGTSYSISTSDTIYVPGMVVYNSSSEEWYNVSTSGYSLDGAPLAGSAQFVPAFGPNGLLFILGGQVSNSGAINYVTTDTINIYDPISEQWKVQAVSGTPPPPSTSSCVVGAQGENGTYEIFLFGGAGNGDIEGTLALANVYVLSLPAFHWQSTTYTPQVGRFHHTCNIKDRQMIVVGGHVNKLADYNDNIGKTYVGSVDPWSQGIGVFDLSDMIWKDSYNASVGPYVTPDIVKSYYAHNPRYPASLLQDPVLRSWFKLEASNGTNTTTTNSSPQSGSHNSDTSAIAGGTVAGVVGVLIAAAALWLLLRRRRRSKARLDRAIPGSDKSELGTSSLLSNDKQTHPSTHLSELPAKPHAAGLQNGQVLSESGGSSVYEMSESRPELPP